MTERPLPGTAEDSESVKFYALRLYERILRSESWALVLCLALNQRATEPPRVAQSLLGTPDAHRCHQESEVDQVGGPMGWGMLAL